METELVEEIVEVVVVPRNKGALIAVGLVVTGAVIATGVVIGKKIRAKRADKKVEFKVNDNIEVTVEEVDQ